MTNPPHHSDDEEARATFQPPREISFHHRVRNHVDGNDPHDDANSFEQSELSTLLAPSAPPHINSYQAHNKSHFNSHPSASTDNGSNKEQKAFRLAALLGCMCIGALFYADLVTKVNSSAVAMDAFKYNNGSSNGSSRETVEEPNNVRKKVSKKTKAQKAKKGSKNEEVDRDDDEAVDEDLVKAKAKKLKSPNDPNVRHSVSATQGDQDKTYDYDYEDEEDDDDDDFHLPKGHNKPHQAYLAPPIDLPTPQKRCPYVIETFAQQNSDINSTEFLREKYLAQSIDPNVFYRATALLFWKDFGAGHWGSINLDDLVMLNSAKYEDGTPLSPMSTWTWITGDQHLSNFGAWRNRGGEVVFSVNDFDEAAIYDFHIDVLRIAVSICSHGFTNGLTMEEVKEALEAFTYTYVKTAIDYVGGDTDLLFEINSQTATGMLRDFLWDTESHNSHLKQIEKFTEVVDGVRRFIRTDHTRLMDVTPEVEQKLRDEMTSKKYGATLMKMGWKVRGWDDDYFTVLDVARRVGSGIGSYGVDRFYVLLKGEDTSLEAVDSGGHHASVILDVKYEPESAVSRILDEVDEDTKSWYGILFNNEADRAAQAQRRLTSYTDPFVGYIEIDGNSYNVRQRSPWKESFGLEKLTDPRAFVEFIEQIAIATATSVR